MLGQNPFFNKYLPECILAYSEFLAETHIFQQNCIILSFVICIQSIRYISVVIVDAKPKGITLQVVYYHNACNYFIGYSIQC